MPNLGSDALPIWVPHVVRGGAGSLCTGLAAFGAYANPENQLPEYGLGVNNHWQRALRGIARGSVNQLADAHVDVDVAPSRTGYMPRRLRLLAVKAELKVCAGPKRGMAQAAAARPFGVTGRMLRYRVERYRAEGAGGLRARGGRSARCRAATARSASPAKPRPGRSTSRPGLGARGPAAGGGGGGSARACPGPKSMGRWPSRARRPTGILGTLVGRPGAFRAAKSPRDKPPPRPDAALTAAPACSPVRADRAGDARRTDGGGSAVARAAQRL